MTEMRTFRWREDIQNVLQGYFCFRAQCLGAPERVCVCVCVKLLFLRIVSVVSRLN